MIEGEDATAEDQRLFVNRRKHRADAFPTLVGALKIAISSCGCTVKQRDSGHATECFAPSLIELLDELDES